MAIKKRKPRNSSLRFQSYLDSSDITKKKPERNLTTGLCKSKSGRNAYGRITVGIVAGELQKNIVLLILNVVNEMFQAGFLRLNMIQIVMFVLGWLFMLMVQSITYCCRQIFP